MVSTPLDHRLVYLVQLVQIVTMFGELFFISCNVQTATRFRGPILEVPTSYFFDIAAGALAYPFCGCFSGQGFTEYCELVVSIASDINEGHVFSLGGCNSDDLNYTREVYYFPSSFKRVL